MIVKGKPVRFHTLSMRSWLVCSAVMVALQGDKMIALLWRSTTVRILLYPCDTGSPTMKSIVMVSQTPLGTSFGLRGTLTEGHLASGTSFDVFFNKFCNAWPPILSSD